MAFKAHNGIVNVLSSGNEITWDDSNNLQSDSSGAVDDIVLGDKLRIEGGDGYFTLPRRTAAVLSGASITFKVSDLVLCTTTDGNYSANTIYYCTTAGTGHGNYVLAPLQSSSILSEDNIKVGNPSDVATEVDTASVGEILADSTNGLTLKDIVRTPEGVIVAWIGGYYTDGINSSYTKVLGSTDDVAGANGYLNGYGWYVCDGSVLNDSDSTIFNGASRYLPNLTDSRFLMGYTSCGNGQGGANDASGLSNHTSLSLNNHTSLSATIPNHKHRWGERNGGDGGIDIHSYNSGGTKVQMIDSFGVNAGIGTTSTYRYSVDYGTSNIVYYTKTDGGGGSVSFTQNITSHSFSQNIDAHSGDNRPKYLSCFYIMKVK